MKDTIHTLPDDDIAAYLLAIEEGLIDSDDTLAAPRDGADPWLVSWGADHAPPPLD